MLLAGPLASCGTSQGSHGLNETKAGTFWAVGTPSLDAVGRGARWAVETTAGQHLGALAATTIRHMLVKVGVLLLPSIARSAPVSAAANGSELDTQNLGGAWVNHAADEDRAPLPPPPKGSYTTQNGDSCYSVAKVVCKATGNDFSAALIGVDCSRLSDAGQVITYHCTPLISLGGAANSAPLPEERPKLPPVEKDVGGWPGASGCYSREHRWVFPCPRTQLQAEVHPSNVQVPSHYEIICSEGGRHCEQRLRVHHSAKEIFVAHGGHLQQGGAGR